MNIILRQASEQDAAAVIAVMNSGVVSKVRRGDLAWGDQVLTEADILPHIQHGNTYVACQGDAVVGTFVLDWHDVNFWGVQSPDAGYIQRFAVDSSQRGQNIGGQMIDLAESEVAAHGGHYLRLVCPSTNPGLRAYYEKQGFSRADGKAKPAAYHPVVYYERPVAGHTETAGVAKHSKPSLFKRLFNSNNE